MATLYRHLIRPTLFRVDAERVHEFGLKSLGRALESKRLQEVAERRYCINGFGEIERFGLRFANPLGMAAGFDKNGIVVNQLASIGFGFVETGTVTFEPQVGNPKPRIFRLPKDNALINRLGFNNQGAKTVAKRLAEIDRRCVLGVNIGKNKAVENEGAIENYLMSLDCVYQVADYIAVNVSSPNTPNLRDLQSADNLEFLLGAIQDRNHELGNGSMKPVLLKIAPDLAGDEIDEITDIAVKHEVAGIIATNTTVNRRGLETGDDHISAVGAGGLSGKPLYSRSNEVIRRIYRRAGGKIEIIGVGGIFSGDDAFEKILAGASLIQAYTGFVYGGIGFARNVNTRLLELIEARGFDNIDDAVGFESEK